MNLQDKLEEIKQLGNCSIVCIYGEDIGCDDLDVKQEERKLKIIMNPVGYLGEVRTFYVGTLKELLEANFKALTPTKVSNPPERGTLENPGYYAWGTERMVEMYLGKIQTRVHDVDTLGNNFFGGNKKDEA